MRAKQVSWEDSAESLLSGGGDKPGSPPYQTKSPLSSSRGLHSQAEWMGPAAAPKPGGIALFNTPLSHSGDQYTIRPWLYPHLINPGIRRDRACRAVQSQTDESVRVFQNAACSCATVHGFWEGRGSLRARGWHSRPVFSYLCILITHKLWRAVKKKIKNPIR